MKILALENCDDEYYIGFAEDENSYMKFSITKEDHLEYRHKWPKTEFRDYDHFAGVIGKFNPHVEMSIDPIPVDMPITFGRMKDVESKMPR